MGLDLKQSAMAAAFEISYIIFAGPTASPLEIATDGPGFTTDEPMPTLGERLALTPFLEPCSAGTEAGLKPIG
jgi:glyoxalase family protein